MADKYINATALLDGMPEVPYKGSLRRVLMQAPAADVVPVRHGRWVAANEQPYFRKKYHTRVWSECRKMKDGKWNYCPNCGALMNKEVCE